MWKCTKCSREFANQHQSHSCSTRPLEEHFRGRAKLTVAIFKRLLRTVKRNGPVTVISSKTRIAFQTRMSFAAVVIRNDFLRGHLVLAERTLDPRFSRIQTISPRNHVHEFVLNDVGDIDSRFCELIAKAYAVGNQEHLRRPAKPL
jgi:hypothetical protein